MQHSRTKHIKVSHYFFCDHVEKGHISLSFIPTHCQHADIFTKSLTQKRFNYICMEIGMQIDNG